MRFAFLRPSALFSLALGLGAPLAAQDLKLVNKTPHIWLLFWVGPTGEDLACTLLQAKDTKIQNLPEGSVKAKVFDWQSQNVCNLTVHRSLGAGVASTTVDVVPEIGEGYRGGACVQKTSARTLTFLDSPGLPSGSSAAPAAGAALPSSQDREPDSPIPFLPGQSGQADCLTPFPTPATFSHSAVASGAGAPPRSTVPASSKERSVTEQPLQLRYGWNHPTPLDLGPAMTCGPYEPKEDDDPIRMSAHGFKPKTEAFIVHNDRRVPAMLRLERNRDDGPASMYLYLIPRSDPDTVHILKHGKLETYQIAPGDRVALYLGLPGFTKTFELQSPDGTARYCPLFEPRTGFYANPWRDPRAPGPSAQHGFPSASSMPPGPGAGAGPMMAPPAWASDLAEPSHFD